MRTSVVSADRWLELASQSGVLIPSRYGFTPQDETRVWEERTISEHMIYFCMKNAFNVVLQDQTITVDRGTFLWIMPGVANETRLVSPRRPFRTYYLRFSLSESDSITPVRLQQDIVHRQGAWPLLDHLRDLVQDLQSPREFHERRIRASLTLLAASALESESRHQVSVLTAQQRLALHAYMETHATEKISPQSLAQQAGLSMPYFSRVFHRSYGMTPRHWILRKRILLAAQIMSETRLTAKEVAYRLGYRDRFLFSRQFKQVMGVSPRLYRRGMGSEPVWDEFGEDMSGSGALTDAIKTNRKMLRRHNGHSTR